MFCDERNPLMTIISTNTHECGKCGGKKLPSKSKWAKSTSRTRVLSKINNNRAKTDIRYRMQKEPKQNYEMMAGRLGAFERVWQMWQRIPPAKPQRNGMGKKSARPANKRDNKSL